MSLTIQFNEQAGKHEYTLNGVRVPSVTQMIEATQPKDLTWWAWRAGLAACVQLTKDNPLSFPDELRNASYSEVLTGEGDIPTSMKKNARTTNIVEYDALQANLHANDIRDAAGDRGTVIHEALTALAAGVVPLLSDFPPEYHAYVQPLCAWWLDQQVEFDAVEQMVASESLQYAGRFDISGTRTDGSRGLWDLKTSKAVYPTSHFLQLAMYEHAWVEMGFPAHDTLTVLNLPGDGTYQEHEARVPESMVPATVQLFYALDEFKDMHAKRGRPTSFSSARERLRGEVLA